MGHATNASRRQLASLRELIFRRALPLERQTILFVLVSALDLFMTCIILHHQVAEGGHFYESNPLANYFLQAAGLRGMVYFKFTMVALIVVVIQTVAIQRLATAQRLFNFATLTSCAVVLYSFALLVQNTRYL